MSGVDATSGVTIGDGAGLVAMCDRGVQRGLYAAFVEGTHEQTDRALRLYSRYVCLAYAGAVLTYKCGGSEPHASN